MFHKPVTCLRECRVMERRSPLLPDEPGFRLIVLAGQRRNDTDRLAERFGQSHRSLVPIAGQPLIAHVLRTALAHPGVSSLAICIEGEAFDPVWDVLTSLPGRGAVTLVPARGNMADSVLDAAQGWTGPLIVTTADHALLNPATIDAISGALVNADLAVALSPRSCVEAVHPSAPRRYITLREGDFAVCDIYGVAGPHALRAADVFRSEGGFDRARSRVRRAAGWIASLMMRLRLLGLAHAVRLASRRLRLDVKPVLVEDGTQAIDVGDDASYAIVRDLLELRARQAAADAANRAVNSRPISLSRSSGF